MLTSKSPRLLNVLSFFTPQSSDQWVATCRILQIPPYPSQPLNLSLLISPSPEILNRRILFLLNIQHLKALSGHHKELGISYRSLLQWFSLAFCNLRRSPTNPWFIRLKELFLTSTAKEYTDFKLLISSPKRPFTSRSGTDYTGCLSVSRSQSDTHCCFLSILTRRLRLDLSLQRVMNPKAFPILSTALGDLILYYFS